MPDFSKFKVPDPDGYTIHNCDRCGYRTNWLASLYQHREAIHDIPAPVQAGEAGFKFK